MKTALIPPVPLLDKYGNGDLHLLLSHLVDEFPAYREHYTKRREAGDYLILDNSAHEHGRGNSMEALLKQASLLRAQEVVVPDVLFDRRATVSSAQNSISWLKTQHGRDCFERAGRPRLMYVPQGEGRHEWSTCLMLLMAIHHGGDVHLGLGPPVIGISKDYYTLKGGLVGIIDEYVVEYFEHDRADVHCLGWPTDLWQLAKVAKKHPWVRSTDSAKPFVYADADILLEPGGDVPAYPRRKETYFSEGLSKNGLLLADRNVAVFEAAANNELIIAGR